jgi:hypothetical protein
MKPVSQRAADKAGRKKINYKEFCGEEQDAETKRTKIRGS